MQNRQRVVRLLFWPRDSHGPKAISLSFWEGNSSDIGIWAIFHDDLKRRLTSYWRLTSEMQSPSIATEGSTPINSFSTRFQLITRTAQRLGNAVLRYALHEPLEPGGWVELNELKGGVGVSWSVSWSVGMTLRSTQSEESEDFYLVLW